MRKWGEGEGGGRKTKEEGGRQACSSLDGAGGEHVAGRGEGAAEAVLHGRGEGREQALGGAGEAVGEGEAGDVADAGVGFGDQAG